MAFISLDNNNFYRPPRLPPPARPRKPSKSPVPPEWMSSFSSQMPSTAYSLPPTDTPILQPPASKPSTEESSPVISSTALIEPAHSNLVPCREPIVPILAAGCQLDDENSCGRVTVEESYPRNNIDCPSRQILPSTEINSENLNVMGIGSPSHLSTFQRDTELLDELSNDVFEVTRPAHEERTSTVPESPISNTSFDDSNQPTGIVDQSITTPVVQGVVRSRDSHVDAATSKAQRFDMMLPCEDTDLDPTVHLGSQARQRFTTTESVPQQADSSRKTRRTTESRSSQSQYSIRSETTVISLRGDRHEKRSQRRPVQAGMRRLASPDSAESDDSEDRDYYGSSDEEDRVSNNELQVRPTKRLKMAKACSVHERQGQDASEVTLPNSSDELSTMHNTNRVEQMRMCGRLFRKITLSQVQYFCYFTENPDSTVFTPELMAFNIKQEHDQDAGNKMSNIQAMDIEGIFTRDVNTRGDTWSWCFKERKTPSPSSNKSPDAEYLAPSNTHSSRSSKSHRQSKRIPYSTEEEELLIDLKKKQNLPWSEIATYFPKRTTGALQVHYSTELKNRRDRKEPPRRIMTRETNTALRSQNHPSTEGNAPGQRYGLRPNRRSPDRYAPE